MSELLLTPVNTGPAIDLAGGRLFRKQILTNGSINYQGRKLDFAPMLSNLVRAFKEKAYPQVSFVLANDDNKHNMNPQNWRGELQGVELTADGLDGIFQLNDDAVKMVEDNPNLGVSARIVVDYERGDGKKWPHALQHVLATLDPRVPNMRPWETVNLSNEGGLPVVDLTDASYEGEEMPQGKEEQQNWTEDDLAAFLNNLDDEGDADPEGDEVDPEGEGGEGDEGPGDELSEHDFEPAGELVGAELSNGGQQSFDLANDARFVELSSQLADTRAELARTRWETERNKLQQDGVPPHLLDLATPVLERDGEQAIELSNGQRVTASSVVRRILEAAKGYIDLSGPAGTSYDVDTKDDPDQKTLEQWSAEYGS